MKCSTEELAGINLKLAAKTTIETLNNTQLQIKQEPMVISAASMAGVVMTTATKSMPCDMKASLLEKAENVYLTSSTSLQVNLGNDSVDDATDYISSLMMPLENKDHIRVQNSLSGVRPSNDMLSFMPPTLFLVDLWLDCVMKCGWMMTS